MSATASAVSSRAASVRQSPRENFQCFRTPRTLAAGLFVWNNEVGGHEVTATEYTILVHMVPATLGCYRALVAINKPLVAKIAAVGQDYVQRSLDSLVEVRNILIREKGANGVWYYGFVDWLRAEVLDAGSKIICGNCKTEDVSNPFFMAPKALLVDYLCSAKASVHQVVFAVYELSMQWDSKTKTAVGEWVEIAIEILQTATGLAKPDSVTQALKIAERDGVIEIRHRSGRPSEYRATPEGLVGGEPQYPRTVERTKEREEKEKQPAEPASETKEDKAATPPIESVRVKFTRCLHCLVYGAVQTVIAGIREEKPRGSEKSSRSAPKPPPKPIVSALIPSVEQPIYEELCKYMDLVRAIPDKDLVHRIWSDLGGDSCFRLVDGANAAGHFAAKLQQNRARLSGAGGWGLIVMLAQDVGRYCADLRRRQAADVERRQTDQKRQEEAQARDVEMWRRLLSNGSVALYDLNLIAVQFPALRAEFPEALWSDTPAGRKARGLDAEKKVEAKAGVSPGRAAWLKKTIAEQHEFLAAIDVNAPGRSRTERELKTNERELALLEEL